MSAVVKVTAAVTVAAVVGGLQACTADESSAVRGVAMPTLTRPAYYDSADVGDDLRRIADLGANWVEFTPTWFQADGQATHIARSTDSPSDTSVERVITLARSLGFHVLLKPHVDVADGTSRSLIEPSDKDAWFRSYQGFIQHYAALAARTQVDMFSVGTELGRLSGDRDKWVGLIDEVRDRYQGTLVYAANFDEYSKVSFWDSVDVVGIDAYWELTKAPTSDVAALKRAWEPIREQLAAFATQKGRRILFTEAGYTSQHGATTKPWSWTISDRPDQAEQAAAYQALMSTFGNETWWAGVFWWCWAGADDGPLGFSPRDKDAEQVLRQAWGS